MCVSVAVVIPTHKRPESLKRAVASVLQQSLQPDEIVIVDDAQSEDTKKFVDSLDSSIVSYVENPSAGASSSRNLGAMSAKSSYVAFLDDDDIWLKDKLEVQVQEIVARDLDACFSRMHIEYEFTNISYVTRSKNLVDASKEILLNNYIGGTISSVIRKDLFLGVGGFDISFPAREEYDLWIRLIHSGAKVGIVEKPLVVAYRSLNKRGRISQDIENYKCANNKLLSKHRDKVCECLGSDAEAIIRYNHSLFLAAQAASINLRVETFKNYYDALKMKFSIKVLLMLCIGIVSPVYLIRIRSLIS